MGHMTPVTRVLAFASAQPSLEPGLTASRDTARYLLGPSASMARLWSQIRLLAPHFRIALLTGEPGTGVEAVAQALHDLSSFADTSLRVLRASEADRSLRNPSTLLDGSMRGSVFLPEIDRLSMSSQQSLLRLIRLRRHRRISIIAASTRDLRPLISAGSFSAELATQLGSLRIAVPALRERTEDIPLLVSYLLQTEAERQMAHLPELDPGFLARAMQQAWPGNLDQMRAVIAWLLENRRQLSYSATELDTALSEVHIDPPADEPVVRMVSLDFVVQEHVRSVLMGCNGNKLRAAEVLGISRSTLYRMLDATSNAEPGSFALAG